MDTKEKHVKENEARAKHEAELRKEGAYATPDQIADSLPANGKNQKRRSHEKTNRLWLWFGVIILVFLLFWWLGTIGIFEDLIGYING